jgi:hypothetical protein
MALRITHLESGKIYSPSNIFEITYDKEKRRLYENKDRRCIYEQFERLLGINKGNFVEMATKKHFEDEDIA